MSGIPLPFVRSATTVLLIDPNRVDRQYWAQRLNISSPDYIILEADTGAAGLAICQSQHVDCVVEEFNLPDMSGFQVLLKLVTRGRCPEMGVVVLSRKVLQPLVRLALEKNGAQACLTKSRVS